VGVVADVTQYSLNRKPPMQIYLADAQYPASFMALVVRTVRDPGQFAAAVRNEIRELDRDQAVFGLATMDELISDSISLTRFSMLLLLNFAALALVLAAVGIYGVISYSVTQRTHEIGIRLAIGAKRSDVMKLVIGHSLKIVSFGLGLGLAVAFLLTRLMSSMLFEVNATDPATFVLVALLLGAVAFIASCIPARRATRVDPIIALRYE
jgi:putative ABC transport system permease protein